MTPPEGNPGRLPAGHHGLSREDVLQSQRERMLEAMIRVAAEKGYHETTVADVIAAAGVSRKTFYEMYEDKEDCFLAAYDAVVDVLIHAVETAYRQTPGTWPQRVHAGIAALAGLLAQESAIARLAMVEVITAGPAARQRYRDAQARFLPFLDEGRAFSEHAGMLPANTSRLAVGSIAALLFDEILAGRGERLGELVPSLTFAALMPFIGREAANEEISAKPEPAR